MMGAVFDFVGIDFILFGYCVCVDDHGSTGL